MAKKNYRQVPMTEKGFFGFERENLRIRPDGSLALTPHPASLGDKRTNKEITTDFSESQIEIVTPVASTIPEAVRQMNRLTRTVYFAIGSELLWPFSSPPDRLPPEEQIPIADFGPAGRDKTDYRIYLANKYGRRRQLFCGLHFNFSFDRRQLEQIFDSMESMNRFYLHLAAQTMRYRFFLVYLLAASPQVRSDGKYRSIRLGVHGYRNLVPIYLDYRDSDHYRSSLQSYINDGTLEAARELYLPVRIKGNGFENSTETAKVERVELRIADLNPFYPCGINPDDLYLMHLFLMWAAYSNDGPFDRSAQIEADALADAAARMSASAELKASMAPMFDRLQTFLIRNQLSDSYRQALLHARQRWLCPEQRYAERIAAQLQGDQALQLARQMKHFFLSKTKHPCR